MKTEPKDKLSFYADCPDGQQNKRFNYGVHDLSHSVDLLNKFKAKGCRIRKAYHTFDNGRNIAIPLASIDGDLTGIYANVKNL